MAEKRRPCKRCGRGRAERFYSSPRGHVCSTCRKKRVAHASKDARLQELYDITITDWEAMLEHQGGGCAICRRPHPNYDVDHDHQAEKVVGTRASIRGLICPAFNRKVLRFARDDATRLRAAADYLEHPPAQAVLG